MGGSVNNGAIGPDNRTLAERFLDVAKDKGLVGLPFEQTPIGKMMASSGLSVTDPNRQQAAIDAMGGFGGVIKAGPYAGLTMAEKSARQGGALASQPGLSKITSALDNHGIEWRDAPNGGIQAQEVYGDGSYKWKHFDTNTSLKTLRDWLGY